MVCRFRSERNGIVMFHYTISSGFGIWESVAHCEVLWYDMDCFPRPTEPDLTNRMENNMKEVDPKSTSRALAFALWMKAPMPMVTLMKTLDVTPLVRLSRKRNLKFNMLPDFFSDIAAQKRLMKRNSCADTSRSCCRYRFKSVHLHGDG